MLCEEHRGSSFTIGFCDWELHRLAAHVRNPVDDKLPVLQENLLVLADPFIPRIDGAYRKVPRPLRTPQSKPDSVSALRKPI